MSSEAISLNAFGTAQASAGGGAEHLAASGLPDTPFVGLRPFESAESLLFFGRREQTTELLQLLDRTRFLAVVGSSGSGKSSLIRAGLIPKLKAGFIIGRSDRWRFVKMKPGNSPLANLAASLLKAFGEGPTPARVEEFVRKVELSGLRAITEYLSARMREEVANVFLLVDQFEEIFRFGAYDEAEAETTDVPGERERRRDEAADFVSFMLELSQQEELPVYVVMTMRSDFLGDCDAFYGLPQAMNQSQYLVPRLTRQQRLEAIESPIRLYGGMISPRLLDRVLNDMGEEPDQLPVMQHAMLRTWEKWAEKKEGPVDLEHYEHEEVGTIKAALSKDADNALAGMTGEELLITERMFQALTKTDARGRRLRRPAHLSEIEAITGADRETVLHIIERFRGHNRSFLTLSEDRLTGDALVDISHESLIRQWVKLGEWVSDEVKSREQYLRLASDAVLHYDPVKPKVALWRDPALQLALDWRDERRPNRAWAQRYHKEFDLANKFLSESEQQRQAEEEKLKAEAAERERLRDEQLRREREERLAVELFARQQRLLARILGVLFLLVIGAAVVAFYAMGKAQTNKAKADKSVRAGALYREAAKAENALKVELAQDKYLEAVEAYKELGEYDAVAHTFTQLGRMMLSQEDTAQDDDTEQARPSEASRKSQINFQTLDKTKVRNWLLGYDRMAPEGFFRALGITPEQQQGMGYYGDAIKTSREHNDLDGSASALDGVGEFVSGSSDPSFGFNETQPDAARWRKQSAIGFFCEAREDFRGASNLEGQISMLTKIGDNLPQKTSGESKETVATTGKGDKGAGEAGTKSGGPALTGCDGQESNSLAYYELTLPLYKELLSQAQGQKQADRHREGWVSMLVKIGELYRREEMTEEALKRFDQAVSLYRDTGNLKKAATTLVEVAGNLPEGKPKDEYYRQAIQTYHDAGKLEEEIQTLLDIGNAYFAKSSRGSNVGVVPELLMKAHKYYQQADAASESISNRKLRARVLLYLAYTYYRLKNPGESLAKFDSALKLAQDENDPELQAEVHMGIGYIQQEKGQTQQAIDSYTKSVELFSVLNRKGQVDYLRQAISKLKKGDGQQQPKQK